MKEIPQRRLAYELRIAIDRCLRMPSDRRYRDRLQMLVDANPHGVWSSHVQHNLGETRRSWMVVNVRDPHRRVVATPGRLVRAVAEEREDGQEAHEPVVEADQGRVAGIMEEALEERA